MKRAFLLAALALAACDPAAQVGEEQRSTAAEEEALSDVPASDDAGQPAAIITAPYNLPAYAAVYPGATIEAANSTSEAGGPGGIVTFTAPAAPASLADHYRTRLRQAGFPTLSGAFANGARMLSASWPDRAERVDIQIAPAPEGSRVTIAYVVDAS